MAIPGQTGILDCAASELTIWPDDPSEWALAQVSALLRLPLRRTSRGVVLEKREDAFTRLNDFAGIPIESIDSAAFDDLMKAFDEKGDRAVAAWKILLDLSRRSYLLKLKTPGTVFQELTVPGPDG